METAIRTRYVRSRDALSAWLPYLNVFFFFEIIYLMITLNILYGNRFAVIVGMALSIALAAHITMLYFRHWLSRYVQLVLMELHAAYSLPLFVNLLTGAFDYHALDLSFIVMRSVASVIEIACIVVLTDETVRAEFD